MPSTQELSHQLDSLTDLRAIVRTMKALAAVSIHQYEEAVESVNDYYRTVEQGIQIVIREFQGPPSALAPVTARRPAAVVFGSDHGLCGRFNEDLVDHALQRMRATPAQAAAHRIVAVGARAAARLEQEDRPVEEVLLVPGSRERITATVQQILLKTEEWQNEGIDHIYLYYNHPAKGTPYRPTGIQLLPVHPDRFQRLRRAPWPSRRVPTFNTDGEALFGALLRQYFFVSVFRACAESMASEQASRLSAMQAAEQNLDDYLEELTTQYRHERQESITAELLDIVSGFEAALGNQY